MFQQHEALFILRSSVNSDLKQVSHGAIFAIIILNVKKSKKVGKREKAELLLREEHNIKDDKERRLDAYLSNVVVYNVKIEKSSKYGVTK